MNSRYLQRFFLANRICPLRFGHMHRVPPVFNRLMRHWVALALAIGPLLSRPEMVWSSDAG